jgi:hypothetical protein
VTTPPPQSAADVHAERSLCRNCKRVRSSLPITPGQFKRLHSTIDKLHAKQPKNDWPNAARELVRREYHRPLGDLSRRQASIVIGTLEAFLRRA